MTTETEQPPVLSPAEELAGRQAEQLQRLRYAQAQREFKYFLRFCYLKDDELKSGKQLMEPWPHLVEAAEAWGTGQSEVILKARQLGFTWLAAAYALWVASYRSSATVLIISMGEVPAQKVKLKTEFIYDHLPKDLQTAYAKKPTVTETVFANGANIMALPSTSIGGSGEDATLVIIDEASKHPIAEENYSAYRPTVADGGQLLMFSTALGMNFFGRMYWNTVEGDNNYTPRFVPWYARPDRDQAWYDNEKANYTGFEEDFTREYPATPAEAFTEKAGLVYPMYDDRVDVTTNPKSHVVSVDPFKWEDAKTRWFGVDWGGGDPTAMGVYGVAASGQIHLFDEFYHEEPVSIQKMGEWLIDWHAKAPFFAGPCDPSQRNSIETLRAAGLPALPADNARQNLGLIASILEQRRITFAERCTATRKEFRGYRWRERTDPNTKDHYATSTPVNNHADAMDVLRYVCSEILHIEHGRRSGQVSTLNGRPRAKKAV